MQKGVLLSLLILRLLIQSVISEVFPKKARQFWSWYVHRRMFQSVRGGVGFKIVMRGTRRRTAAALGRSITRGCCGVTIDSRIDKWRRRGRKRTESLGVTQNANGWGNQSKRQQCDWVSFGEQTRSTDPEQVACATVPLTAFGSRTRWMQTRLRVFHPVFHPPSLYVRYTILRSANERTAKQW